MCSWASLPSRKWTITTNGTLTCLPVGSVPGSIQSIFIVWVNSKTISSTTRSIPIVRETGVMLVSGGKFKLHMLVPAIRQSLLRSCKSVAGQVFHEEFERTEICQFRSGSVVMISRGPSESVVLIFVVVNSDQWIWVKRVVNRSLSFGRTKAV